VDRREQVGHARRSLEDRAWDRRDAVGSAGRDRHEFGVWEVSA